MNFYEKKKKSKYIKLKLNIIFFKHELKFQIQLFSYHKY